MQFIKNKQFKANLHCHSILSDGRLTPEELKKAYKEQGYSILSITDHERPHNHTELSDPDFLMLTGYEVYIRPDDYRLCHKLKPEIHINLLAKDPTNVAAVGFDERYIKYVKDPAERAKMVRFNEEERVYTVDYINHFIETAKEAGYLVTLNHPVWSLEDFEEVFRYKGYFTMEMCNYSSYVSGLHEYNGALYDMILRRGMRIGCHSADDNHNVFPIHAPGSDSFGGFAMVCTEDDTLTYDGVIRALENKTFYSSMGPVIHTMEVENNIARITCSPVERISLMDGSKSPQFKWKATKDGCLTEAEFEIPSDVAYIRFNIQDQYGRIADTRGYFRDEWEQA